MKQLLLLMVFSTPGAFAVAAEPAGEPPFAARCRTLRACAEVKIRFLAGRAAEELRAAATDEQRQAAKERAQRRAAELLERFDRLLLQELAAEAHDPAAVETLVWIIHTRRPTFANEAAGLLRTHHLIRRETIDLAVRNAAGPMKWVEPLLRAQLLALPPKDASRPRVLLALAMQKQFDSRLARRLTEMSAEVLRETRLLYGDETIEAGKKIDPLQAEEEAAALFTELEARYGSQPATEKTTFGRIARSALFEIRHLAVGRIAPELTGEDIDGKPLRLREYRGKVVLVSFWATWCGPCMARIPYEKRLVARFAERDFVLLGVNADTDRKKVESEIERVGIPWRSLWCGPDGPDGEIPSAWNITSWPTIYVIDHQGVICAKDPDDEALERLLDELVARAETAAAPPTE
jgi:thiol-disulfide isomerase/thioredoxin